MSIFAGAADIVGAVLLMKVHEGAMLILLEVIQMIWLLVQRLFMFQLRMFPLMVQEVFLKVPLCKMKFLTMTRMLILPNSKMKSEDGYYMFFEFHPDDMVTGQET